MRRIDYDHKILFDVVLVLFVLQLLLLPLVVEVTYASRSKTPEHILTYHNHALSWDKNTVVNDHGVAVLSFFEPYYNHVLSLDGTSIIAPGTEKETIIRLQNDTANKISYNAILFFNEKEASIPVESVLSGENFIDAEIQHYPDALSNQQIIRAVSGELQRKQMQEFDISWSWLFENGTSQDEWDTYLGNLVAENSAYQLGFYLVVYDDGKVITPNTSDSSWGIIYFMMLLVSGSTLFLLSIERRKYYD